MAIISMNRSFLYHTGWWTSTRLKIKFKVWQVCLLTVCNKDVFFHAWVDFIHYTSALARPQSNNSIVLTGHGNFIANYIITHYKIYTLHTVVNTDPRQGHKHSCWTGSKSPSHECELRHNRCIVLCQPVTTRQRKANITTTCRKLSNAIASNYQHERISEIFYWIADKEHHIWRTKIFTSDDSDTNIKMYDCSAKGGEYHSSTENHPTDQHHRSAAVAVDKDTADRSCTEERNNSCFWELYGTEATFVLVK